MLRTLCQSQRAFIVLADILKSLVGLGQDVISSFNQAADLLVEQVIKFEQFGRLEDKFIGELYQSILKSREFLLGVRIQLGGRYAPFCNRNYSRDVIVELD